MMPSARRIYGLALRHIYLYMESWPRLVEMMYWPIINTMLLGFVSLAIVNRYGHVDVMTDTYVGGVLLTEIISRSVMAIMLVHMEEVWSRNLGHLFASPLRMRDYIAGGISIGSLRCLIAVTPAFILAYYLFGFSILQLNWELALYIALLLFNGWWIGMMIVSLLLRFGLAAEWLGWMCIWLLIPFMAPYYPVSILPKAFQVIAWALPGTYVFESMKIQIATGAARMDYLGIALVLNIVYFLTATTLFSRAFLSAKNSGGLLQMGE